MRKLLCLLFVSCFLVGCSNTDENTSINEIESAEENIDTEICSREETARIYYFDTVNLELKYATENYTTNDNLWESLLDYLKTNDYENSLKIPKDAIIDNVDFNSSSGVLTINFSKDFLSDMPLGTATESGLISSIVETYGYNYKTDKVAIYLGDTLYEGLKGTLDDGYFETNDSSFIGEYRVFYYDGNLDKVLYSDQSLEVNEKAVLKTLSAALSSPPKDNLFKFEDCIEVISAEVKNDSLYVNLSDKYYDILNRVGSGSELGALHCLAYTYGYNYGVSKVYLTFNGKPYMGSHVTLDENQPVIVNITDCVSID